MKTYDDYRQLVLDATPWERERILEDALKDLDWQDVARLARIGDQTAL